MLLGKPYNTKVDCWSLGITAYSLLVGDIPWVNKDPREAMKFIPLADAPTLPPRRREHLWSPTLRDFLKCCLTKDPVSRWNSFDLLCHPLLSSIPQTVSNDEIEQTLISVPKT